MAAFSVVLVVAKPRVTIVSVGYWRQRGRYLPDDLQ